MPGPPPDIQEQGPELVTHRSWQTTARGTNPECKPRMVGKKIKTRMTPVTQEKYTKCNFKVDVEGFSGTQPRLLSKHCPQWLLVVTETMWPAKLKIFTFWPFTK